MTEPTRDEVERQVRDSFAAYSLAYAARDRSLFDMFDDDFTGFAAACHRITTGKDDWVRLTERDFGQIEDPLDLEIRDLQIQGLADDVYLVAAVADLTAQVPDGDRERFRVRHVQVRRRDGERWMIVHSSTSGPVPGGTDEVYPIQAVEGHKQAVESEVQQRTVALERANRELAQLSRVDGLTGVANRRHLDEVLEREWERARRDRRPLALLMIDIDHFKDFNDRYGHLAGDECLQTVTQVLDRSAARRSGGDLVARFGGEEFAVLLAAADEAGAMHLAARFRDALAALAVPHEGSPSGVVTASTGVASMIPAPQEGPETLVERADRALYEAKGAGRDRIVLSSS